MADNKTTVYRGKIIDLYLERVTLPNGAVAELEIIRHPGGAAVVALDNENRVCLLRQYRHAAGEDVLELPAGTLDPGEDPHDCAVRECREEIGMTPGRLIHLGDCYLAPGYSSELNHMYLALDLSAAPLAPDEDEEISLEPVPLNGLQDLLRRGEIRDGKTLATLLLALPLLEQGTKK